MEIDTAFQQQPGATSCFLADPLFQVCELYMGSKNHSTVKDFQAKKKSTVFQLFIASTLLGH